MNVNNAKERFRPFGMRHSLRGLALLVLSGVGPESIPDQFRQRPGFTSGGVLHAKEAAPYLPAIGPPGLRFREPESAPTFNVRPVAVGPPMPGLSVMETTVAVANTTARLDPLNPAQATDAHADVTPPGVDSPPGEHAAKAAGKPAPPPILRDDVKPPIRPEDFLPYFQVPGVPLSPSSATYTQTPK